MAGFGIIAIMAVCALVTFALLLRWVRAGGFGLALSVLSVIGGCLTILIYATGRPFGINPLLAMDLALLWVFPSLLGGLAGALLGWLLRRRDDRKG
ncbi:UDP-N-acetylmuramate--alanine ligase [Yoonia sp.]|uniref:UDP-N-acetylmuramate--alanine ligase n=1 Tax=Yoonia sp. TaxID=2212373 RepID=UPI001A0BDAB6|nr:UDP-N-acetylmuramate--alanine ligase [Yoonia sp.]MBE0413552.1 UDP-N-acetylmuramate--alanine ligase [Yoonia sp.]